MLLIVLTLYYRLDYESGTNVTFTAEAAEGWKFVRWQGSASGFTNPLEVTVLGEMNVVAVFEKNIFTLNTTIVGQGSITRSSNASAFEAGSVVTLTSSPVSGWKFVRWDGDASGTNKSVNVTMDTDKNVQATFAQLQNGNWQVQVNVLNTMYIKGTIKIYNKSGALVKEINQTTWARQSLYIFANVPLEEELTAKMEFYISNNGKNAITSGKTSSSPELTIGSGGLIKHEIKATLNTLYENKTLTSYFIISGVK